MTATLTVVDSASKTVSMPLHITVFAAPTATIAVDPASVLEKGKDVRFLVTSATPTGTAFTDFDSFSTPMASMTTSPSASERLRRRSRSTSPTPVPTP